MTYEEAFASLSRIFAFFSPDPKAMAEYTKAIVDAIGWMRSDFFDEVCKELVREMGPGRRPVPSQFGAVYKRLAEQRGWKRFTEGAKKCSGCLGLMWVQAVFKRISTMEQFYALKPCPLCNTGHWIQNSDLVEIECKHEDWCEREAKQLTPQAAQKILTLGDAMPKYSDSVMQILLEIAGQEMVSPLPKK